MAFLTIEGPNAGIPGHPAFGAYPFPIFSIKNTPKEGAARVEPALIVASDPVQTQHDLILALQPGQVVIDGLDFQVGSTGDQAFTRTAITVNSQGTTSKDSETVSGVADGAL